MITRNWYANLKSNHNRAVITNGIRLQDGSYASVGYYASYPERVYNALVVRETDVVFNSGAAGIVLGSGNTPPTIDDYCLESMITSGLSPKTIISNDENGDLKYTITMTNTSQNPITIGEVGIMSKVYTGANTNTSNIVLMERTVLEEPITIPANGVGVVTYITGFAVPEA